MRQRLIWLVVAVVAVVPAFGVPISVNLGPASTFGLLGGTISNTGTSEVTGNVGATTTVTGFPPGIATGTVFPAPSNPTVTAAYTAFTTAFGLAMGLGSTQSFADLTTGTTFLGNEVYQTTLTDISTTTGAHLIFDAQGLPNQVFVIRPGRDFTVNGVLTFDLQNGAQANNIFWVVGRNATISVGSSPGIIFEGNILAGDTFTMSAAEGGSGTLAGRINGCVFAVNANTLAGKTEVGGCRGTASDIPEPASSGLVGLGCLLGILAWRRFRVSV